MIGIVILVVYTAIMLTATLLFTKRSEGEDFHVGNRKMGTFPSAMSIAATWIWAPALLVSAENAYKMGIPGLFWFVVPNVLCLMLFIPFAKKIREKMQNGITLSGFMGTQYKSTGVKRVYGFQLSFLAILSTAVQLLAGGSIVSKITGLPFILVTIILAAIAFSYSQFSGIRASVLTDVIQMALILAGCALMVPWALGMHGGVNNLVKGLGGITGEFRSLLGSSGWKKKKTNPTAEKILVICKVLEVTPEWLLSGVESRGTRSNPAKIIAVDIHSEAGELLELFNSYDAGLQSRILGYAQALGGMKTGRG